MTYDGYLAFGGNEIANNARTKGYAETARCPMYWFKGEVCAGIYDALGETNLYTYANITSAPWYDSVNEESTRFFGVYIIDVDGLENSTRSVSVTEGVGHGGVLGPTRKAVKTVKMKALLVGQGRDALEYGMAWLSSVLDPGTCGQHGQGCGTVDLAFFADCPPTQASITMPETLWGEPITNLAKNPSMEAAGATVEVAKNLATNPSFELANAGTQEVRRNFITNPSFEVNTTGWNTYGSDVTIARDTTQFHRGAASLKVTQTTVGTKGAQSRSYPVTTGRTYTLTMWVLASAGVAPTTVTLAWYNGATFVLSSYDTRTLTVGQWTKFTVTAAAPATATQVDVIMSMVAAQLADVRFIDEVLLEQSGVVGTYFDGSTLPAGDFLHSWAGTANASESIEYGTTAAGAAGGSNSAAVFQSSEWSSSGSKSIRFIPRVTSTTTWGYLCPGIIVVPEKTYTLQALLRLAAPLTSPAENLSRRIAVWFGGSVIYSDPAPNVAGVHPVRMTVMVPAGVTMMEVRGYLGVAKDNGEMWLDDLLITEGVYNGPYFDGSTPPKVRRNLASNPANGDPRGWSSNNGAYYPQTVDSTVMRRPGTKSRRFDRQAAGASVTLASSYSVGGLDWNIGGRSKVSPGVTYTFSAYAMTDATDKPNGTIQVLWYDLVGTQIGGMVSGSWTEFNVPRGTWFRATATLVAPAGAAYGGIVAFNIGGPAGFFSVGGEKTWMTDAQIEEGPVATEYLDGAMTAPSYVGGWDGTAHASPSYLTDSDFTYVWSGTPNASTSEKRAPRVASYSPGGAQAIQSSHWAGDRAKSMRIISQWPSPGSAYADVAGTGFENGLVPGTSYTLTVKVYMKAARGIDPPSVGIPAQTAGYSVYALGQDVAGEQTITMPFTVPPTGWWYLRLYNNAPMGLPDVWFDALTVVEGDYPGDYFDGEFPDSPLADYEVVGKQVVEYEWTGTPDASTSTVTTGSIIAVEDSETWERLTTDLVRYLHDTGAVSGPLVTGEFESAGFFANQVEVTFTSERPWVFKATKPVALPPSLPVVVQDIPFNLAPYPSAELSSGTVIVAKNFVPNPSFEVDTANWTFGGIAPAFGTTVASRSTEISANGTAAYKIRFTATAAGNTGEIYGLSKFPIAAGVGRRMSVNSWQFGAVSGGAAVLSTLQINLSWLDASNNAVGPVIPLGPPIAASGGPIAAKSLLVPDGATQAQIVPYLKVTSWQVGAIIDLFIDAVAVTVP